MFGRWPCLDPMNGDLTIKNGAIMEYEWEKSLDIMGIPSGVIKPG